MEAGGAESKPRGRNYAAPVAHTPGTITASSVVSLSDGSNESSTPWHKITTIFDNNFKNITWLPVMQMRTGNFF